MNLSVPTREQRNRGITRRGRQVGLTDRIREALRSGPLTAKQIAARLNANLASVVSILGQIRTRTGGIYRTGDRREYTYTLAKPEASPDNPRVAGRITHGRGAKWGAGLV